MNGTTRDLATVRQPILQNTEVHVELVESSKKGAVSSYLVNPAQVHKVSDPQDLVELARQVQKAEGFVRCRAVGRLEVIAEQIRHLQDQARRVLQEAHRDDLLHHAACNFKKVPGSFYHLYERNSGQKYFSMIAPEEWGPSCPHTYLGGYRLEADMSWTPAEKTVSRSKEIELMDQILSARKTLSTAALEMEKEDSRVPEAATTS